LHYNDLLALSQINVSPSSDPIVRDVVAPPGGGPAETAVPANDLLPVMALLGAIYGWVLLVLVVIVVAVLTLV
jgi:hypothetical protein